MKEISTFSVAHIQEYILNNPDEFTGKEQVTISFFLPGKEITYFDMSIQQFMRS